MTVPEINESTENFASFIAKFSVQKQRCLIILLLIILLSSCVNGPVRCRLNGRFNYLTMETAKNCSWYTYPVTLPAAAVCDAGIIVADTVAVPVVSLRFLGPVIEANPLFLVFWIPFYPIACVTTTAFSCDSPHVANGSMMYQWLFGYQYYKTQYGIIKIIQPTKANSRTVFEMDGQTIGELDGHLDTIAVSENSVTAFMTDTSLHWLHCVDGKWESNTLHLVPDNSELSRANNKEIWDLKQRVQKLEKSNDKYEQQSLKWTKESITRLEIIEMLLKNEHPTVVKVIPRYSPATQFQYMLRLTCHSYVFDVECISKNGSVFVVHVYDQ